MKSPVCPEAVLVMSDRQGVEKIDYCPSCRGVWLDRGELDKPMQKAAAMESGSRMQANQSPSRPARPDFVDSDYRHRSGPYGQTRRKSWLSEIFD